MRLALFDLDGTVTDPGLGITNSVMYALDKFGIRVKDREELYPFVGPPLRESFCKYYKMTADETELAVKYYREYYGPVGIFECSLYDGIVDTFEKLAENGVRSALATAKPETFAKQLAQHFDFEKYLVYISGASLDKSRDNKADIISEALKNIHGAVASETVMIGDRSYDIEGGIKNGCKTIGVTYGYGKPEEFLQADATVDTAYGIADAVLSL